MPEAFRESSHSKGGHESLQKVWRKLHPSQARCVDQAIEYEHGNGAPAPGLGIEGPCSALCTVLLRALWGKDHELGLEQFAVTFIFSSSADVFGKLLKYGQARGWSPLAEDIVAGDSWDRIP